MWKLLARDTNPLPRSSGVIQSEWKRTSLVHFHSAASPFTACATSLIRTSQCITSAAQTYSTIAHSTATSRIPPSRLCQSCSFKFSSPSSRGFATHTLEERKAKADKRAIERYGFNPLNYKVAIFGRPNVGKSTVFNRLVGRHLAIVDKRPGVTRDRREADASIGDLEFRLIDTAGLEQIQKFLTKDKHEYQLVNNEPMNKSLQESIIRQTESAIAECDVALFVIDGREGVTPLDRYFSKWLRRQCSHTERLEDANGKVIGHLTSKKPVVLLANKCDNSEQEQFYHGLTEGYELGFGEPLSFSADHAAGLSGLHNALYDAFLQVHERKQQEFPEREKAINAEIANLSNIHEIRLAITGKVNVGKSTLINTLLGQERVLTGSQPGVTRDAIEIPWRDEDEESKELKVRTKFEQMKEQQKPDSKPLLLTHDEADAEPAEAAEIEPTPLKVPSYRFTLVDTAGLKGVTRHAHSKYSPVDAASMMWSLRSIDRANVVALMVDISEAGMDGVMRDPKIDASHNTAESNPALNSKPASHEDPIVAADRALIFKPGKKYTEEERGHLLRTYVRNIFSANDLAIASKILKEGRALVLLLNKFDLVPTLELKQQILQGVALLMEDMLPLAGNGVTVLGISGSEAYDSARGQPLKTTVRQAVIYAYEKWHSRISTHKLNAWLRELLKFHPPPLLPAVGGLPPKRIILKFIQQVTTGPPTFVIFANRSPLPDEYKRFLLNALRREFNLGGVAVRLHVRVRKNPYLDSDVRKASKERKDALAKEAAEIPTFAKDDDASLEAEEFNEDDYTPLDAKEISFDYDDMMKQEKQNPAGREELRREKLRRETMEIVAKSANSSSISRMSVATDRPIPRVNTSSIFASQRRVAPPKRKAQPAFDWSVQRNSSSQQKQINSAALARTIRSAGNQSGYIPDFPEKKKPFGTRRPKKDKATDNGTVQGVNVLRTIAKVDNREKLRKENTKHKRIAFKSTQKAMKGARF